MRPIDADALESEMLSHAPIIVGDFYKIIDLVDNTPTIDSFGSWIPVEERSPEVGGHYLITNIDGLVKLDYFRKTTNDFDNYSVVAWMPIPKPYEVKSNEI